MAKLKSDVKVKDFLKLCKSKQEFLLTKDISVCEKYDGVKLSVIYDPFLFGDFIDQFIVSYKGFRIFRFEKLDTKRDITSSYGYAQFSFIWDVLKEMESYILAQNYDSPMEFMFEAIIRKPTLATRYKKYHNLIYLRSRECDWNYSNGIVEIIPDEKFKVEGFLPDNFYPLVLTSRKFSSVSSLLKYAYQAKSEFGGDAEGVILKIDGETYKIVDPKKRTKEYRMSKTKDYFIADQITRNDYAMHIDGASDEIVFYNMNRSPHSPFEKVLKLIHSECYDDFSDEIDEMKKFCEYGKTTINFMDDLYLACRIKLINEFKDKDLENEETHKKSKITPEIAKLTLIRGLPGSGKSTIAAAMFSEGLEYVAHLEADMFFTDPLGNYKYDPNLVRFAHQWCLSSTIKHLIGGNKVIVSNTFTTWEEIYPYLKFSIDNGIECCIIEAQGKFSNVHDVPDDVLEKMKSRWMSTDKIKQMYNILKQKEN